MIKEAKSKESVARAFSTYVKTCLQHARKDYLVKQNRENSRCILMDAVTFEINIEFTSHVQGISSIDDTSNVFSQLPGLPQLTQKEYKVLYYKYTEDKTDKEIAQLLGVSRQAVSKIKSNGLAKLKRAMEIDN